MRETSIIYQYITGMDKHDYKNVLMWPIISGLLIIIILSLGTYNEYIDYLTDIIPVTASITIGFLGMIIVASMAGGPVFDIIKKIPLDDSSHSVYFRFFTDLCFNLIYEIILLAITLIIGSINNAYILNDWCYIVESFIIIFFFMSSSLVFINNMRSMYWITVYRNN